MNLNRLLRHLLKGTRYNKMRRVLVPRRRVNNAAIKRVTRVLRVLMRSRRFRAVQLTLLHRFFVQNRTRHRSTRGGTKHSRRSHRHQVASIMGTGGRSVRCNSGTGHIHRTTGIYKHLRLIRLLLANIVMIIRRLMSTNPLLTNILRLFRVRYVQFRPFNRTLRRSRRAVLQSPRQRSTVKATRSRGNTNPPRFLSYRITKLCLTH